MYDLGTIEMMENYGRERRHRYYTYVGHRQLLSKDPLFETSGTYSSADFASVGNFMPLDEAGFWYDSATLRAFEQTPRGKRDRTGDKAALVDTISKERKRKRGPNEEMPSIKRTKGDQENSRELDPQSAPRKRGRPPKVKPENEGKSHRVPRLALWVMYSQRSNVLKREHELHEIVLQSSHRFRSL